MGNVKQIKGMSSRLVNEGEGCWEENLNSHYPKYVD
jgi:hypothetical protein